MKTRSLTLWLAATATMLLVTLPVHACLNETGTNTKGQVVDTNAHSHEYLREDIFNKMPLEEKISRARDHMQTAKRQPSYDAINDLAVSLIRLGDYENAIKHLKLIERKSPGRYQTAANLGTAYELLGNNSEALHWIKLGILRNKDAHNGTEWLHARILDAKINPSQIPKGSILKLDFGNQTLSKKPKNLPLGNVGKTVSLFNLAEALRYQLLERTEFVDAPDPVVAGLLYDWGNLELAVGTMESADIAYQAAKRYGYPDKAELTLRHNEAKRIMRIGEMKSKFYSATGMSNGQAVCEICEPPAAEANP